MQASLSAAFIRTITGWYVKRIDAENADVGKMRRRWDFGARLLIPAFGVRVEKTTVAERAAEWLTPRKSAVGKLLFYLHGGAYVMGGPATHRQLVSHIARAAGVRALVLDYRLAPEHKFPAAIDDAVAAYRALLQQGIRAEDIVFAGDSAGGGLVVATLMTLRDAGDPMPAGAVLMSPFLDVTGSGESTRSRAALDPWFRPESIAVVARHYCEPGQEDDPRVSPVFGDMTGMPPLYIQVGDREILLSDSERLAGNQQEAGGSVELEVWPGMWHVFQVCIHKMPESRLAIRKIGAWIRRR